jgi:hypothetical protein
MINRNNSIHRLFAPLATRMKCFQGKKTHEPDLPATIATDVAHHIKYIEYKRKS